MIWGPAPAGAIFGQIAADWLLLWARGGRGETEPSIGAGIETEPRPVIIWMTGAAGSANTELVIYRSKLRRDPAFNPGGKQWPPARVPLASWRKIAPPTWFGHLDRAATCNRRGLSWPSLEIQTNFNSLPIGGRDQIFEPLFGFKTFSDLRSPLAGHIATI